MGVRELRQTMNISTMVLNSCLFVSHIANSWIMTGISLKKLNK